MPSATAQAEITLGAIVLNERDNVATALHSLRSAEKVRVRVVETETFVDLINDIPAGHKLALTDIRRGDYVIKYGEVIGKAISAIHRGSHVHVHNVESLRGRGDLGT
jgi:altronate dehydratase small subunit